MLPGVDPSIPARGLHVASTHGHSTTESPAIKSLLAVTGARAYDTRGNPLHLILAVERQFLLHHNRGLLRIAVIAGAPPRFQKTMPLIERNSTLIRLANL